MAPVHTLNYILHTTLNGLLDLKEPDLRAILQALYWRVPKTVLYSLQEDVTYIGCLRSVEQEPELNNVITLPVKSKEERFVESIIKGDPLKRP